MAECPSQDGAAAGLEIKEKNHETPAVDEELDELLNDALQDFDKPPQKKAEELEEKSKHNVAKSYPEHQRTPPGTPTTSDNSFPFDGMLSEEDLAKMAEEFNKAFQSIPDDDMKLFQEFGKMAMGGDTTAPGASEKPTDIEGNLAKAWNELTQNMKDAHAQTGEGEMDAEFVNVMKSLGVVDQDGSADGIIGMMHGMMKNLLSKDILYPSLKDIQNTYPAWLEENKGKVSEDDYERYSKQYKLVCDICEAFENENESDSEEVKKEKFDKIMEKMHQMQECGQPPADVISHMAEESESPDGAANTEMPNPEQCIIS